MQKLCNGCWVGELFGDVSDASVKHHAAPEMTTRQGHSAVLAAYPPAGIRRNEENSNDDSSSRVLRCDEASSHTVRCI